MSLELVILEGPEAGRRIPVPAAPITLGRAPAAAMAFPDDGFISSVHLSMQSESDGVRITDLRSTNGTFLNNERVTSALAGVGDVIQIGTMTMQVTLARPENAIPVYSSSSATAPSANTVVSTSLPPMHVPAPPSLVPSVGATTTIPRIAVDGSERFRFQEGKQPETESTAKMLLARLADVSSPLFVMVNAAADDGIRARLAMGDVDLAKHCLWHEDGLSTPARWAPYLIPMKQDSPLLNVLLDSGWGKGWLSLLASSAPLGELVAHFSKFLKVQMEGTGGIYFRFYEPQVLRQFISSGSPAEAAMFFGPVQEWFLEGEAKGTLLHASHGPAGLNTQTVALQ